MRRSAATSLRVLLVTPRYFPLVGGVENHVHQVATRFGQAGIDATVLTTDPHGAWPAEEWLAGVHVLRVRAWPTDRDYYVAPGLVSLISRGNWDIVHCQGYHTFVPPLAMLAALGAKIPYVLTFHGGGHSSRLRNRIRGTQQRLLRPLLARAERLIAVANFEVDHYGKRLRLPRERFVVIPNGADFGNLVPTPSAGADGTLIVSVGRLEQYKGHHRIIAAMPKVLEQCPNARLWIAGVGPYEADLRRQAHALGVAERVDIHAIPAAERQTMLDELSKAALVVLLSEYETHPIAVLEALALGRPVLVAYTSGLSEVAERGWARAIPLNSSPEAVAAAVLGQLRQPLVPSQIELPTWDQCAADLLSLYQQVLSKAQVGIAQAA